MASRALGQDLLVGIELGHYRILEKIGTGGMGEVYRARDEHLDRDVAIKVLPPGTLIDESARKHFHKEALILSQLNHPNVATIHDFDTQQGVDFLVMEYIPGITLSAKVAGRPLPEKEVLRLGVELAEGLAAAHSRGIVHRDLKPSNIWITIDGRLKVLDFGLAKLRRPVTESATTESLGETQSLAGTLPYMAPEQLLGAEVDARTDIHGVGTVLYELATGQRPFGKLEHALLISAILQRAPATPGQLNPKVSPELERIIGKCMEKEPEDRYQSAKELAIDLRRLLTLSAAEAVENRTSRRRSGRITWGSVAFAVSVVSLLAIGGTIYMVTRPPPMPRVVGSHVLTKSLYMKGRFVVSDGRSVYFVEGRPSGSVVLQVPISGGEASELPNAVGIPADISADGSQMLTLAPTLGGTLDAWAVPLPAGTPRLVVHDVSGWARWAADGRGIFFSHTNDTELYRVNSDGSDLRLLAKVPNISHLHRSPDGQRLRFSVFPSLGLWQVDADGSHAHAIFPEQKEVNGGTWSPDGEYYFFTSWDGETMSLWGAPEAQSWWRKNVSNPQPLTFGPISIGAPISSRDGRQLYAVGIAHRGELSIYDHKLGGFVPHLSGISVCYVDFSRDGQWIAYVSYPEGTLWRSRIDGSEKRQLTVPPLAVINPRWSPDGKLITFVDISNGDRRRMDAGTPHRIYVVSADGGAPMLLVEGQRLNDPTWSPDGKSIAYGYRSSAAVPASEVRILDLATQKSTKVPGSEGLWSPRWSPDGRYIVARVNFADGKSMLFDFARKSWEELASGTDFSWPCWSRDSKFVYAQDADSLFRIAVLDHKKEVVAPLGGIRTTAYFFDRWNQGWFGLTPDGHPITTRDTGVSQVYAFDLAYK